MVKIVKILFFFVNFHGYVDKTVNVSVEAFLEKGIWKIGAVTKSKKK